MDDVFKFSAIDLAMRAYEQAFSENGDVSLLDKPLLKDMQKFKNIFDKYSEEIPLYDDCGNSTTITGVKCTINF